MWHSATSLLIDNGKARKTTVLFAVDSCWVKRSFESDLILTPLLHAAVDKWMSRCADALQEDLRCMLKRTAKSKEIGGSSFRTTS